MEPELKRAYSNTDKQGLPKVLPRQELIEKTKVLNIEKIIKDCWYMFIEWVYKDKSFNKISAFMNPQTGSVKITDSKPSSKYNNNTSYIELYSINYNELKNIQGRNALESTFHIDRVLRTKKEQGYFEDCRYKMYEEIDKFYEFKTI